MLLKFLVLFSTLVLNDAVYSSSDGSCRFFSLQNGRVRWRQRHQLARFMCFQGYVLVGNRYASCVNGEWDAPVPVCVRPGCTVPNVTNSLIVERHYSAWVTIFCLPGFERHGPSVMYCDGRRWNGTAPSCDPNSHSQSQLSCDFEDPQICGWKQDELHDFDWKRLSGKTPSAFLNTGPKHDHTYENNGTVEGYYMYIESTSRLENDTARLISPVYDQSLSENGCFSFFYHMYGRSIGGLRVYQKPDSLQLETMMKMSEEEKQQLLLFEMWGNQGDTWFRDVSTLRNQSEDFQIVIEGLRGTSYTSDIAIDDVAILEGQNCSLAKQQASTPPEFNTETCTNRCNLMGTYQPAGACDCTITCLNYQRCCADFFEVCVFSPDSTTTDDDKPSSGDQPQTEKLVAFTAINASQTTTIPTTSTTSTTSRPTTAKLTTTKIVPLYTTVKKDKTTTKKIIPKPKVSSSTAAPIAKSNFTKILRITTMTTTKAPTLILALAVPKSSYSGWRTTLLVIAILICCVGFVWMAHKARGARGRLLISRIRGRVQQDPEVRYLHADTDDP